MVNILAYISLLLLLQKYFCLIRFLKKSNIFLLSCNNMISAAMSLNNTVLWMHKLPTWKLDFLPFNCRSGEYDNLRRQRTVWFQLRNSLRLGITELQALTDFICLTCVIDTGQTVSVSKFTKLRDAPGAERLFQLWIIAWVQLRVCSQVCDIEIVWKQYFCLWIKEHNPQQNSHQQTTSLRSRTCDIK